MNFRVSLRDRRGGVRDAGTTVTVNQASGPFQLTTQNALPAFAPEATWQTGSTQTVTWDAANTNAAPVNAANVNILLSTDGGQTFPITLAANTPNDGSETITVPNNPTTTARIKIQPTNNIFFDINNANFTISAPTAAAVSISGRVISSDGSGISNAVVMMTDQNGVIRTAKSSSFGYYRFEDVEVGQTFTFNISHRRYQFSPIVASVNNELFEFNFASNN